jgi:hypothetical protein
MESLGSTSSVNVLSLAGAITISMAWAADGKAKTRRAAQAAATVHGRNDDEVMCFM